MPFFSVSRKVMVARHDMEILRGWVKKLKKRDAESFKQRYDMAKNLEHDS